MLYFLSHAPIPDLDNPGLLEAVEEIRRQPSQKRALTAAYHLIGQRFRSYRFRTYLQFWQAWEDDPNVLWEKTEFLHCHHQNYLLRVLLIESGWFAENEILLGFSFVWHVSPHQYLKIKLVKKMVAADPWNYDFGAQLGQYASGFGLRDLG